jgi:hypothetical protein
MLIHCNSSKQDTFIAVVAKMTNMVCYVSSLGNEGLNHDDN